MEVNSEADRKLAEKDEEMEQINKNSQRVMDSMLSMLNSVVRSRSNAVWIKKKIEGDMNGVKIEPKTRLLGPRNKLKDVHEQLRLGYGS
ncbi:hypothetical protein VZT92_027034 [Zoarces viviparus]|uniref:Uncharacterized protein n=1 Tax=Zoarces viviparus TaxID=48416 RepID=A0AAW1DSU5_ZOAVI